MGALPTGTVTFLLTDVEGSTRRWEEHPDAMRAAMARHDEIISGGLAAHGGLVVESGREGDSVLAAFNRAADAVACALELQRTLRREGWPAGAEIRVRMALNSGEAELRGGHYYGQVVYRCARTLVTGYGGQVLASQATCDLVEDNLPSGASLVDLGFHHLKDLERPEHIYQLGHPELEVEFPPLRTLDGYRHNLPFHASTFIDRPRELAQVLGALAEERLVTLTGAAGCGKTRLALQAAAEVVDGHADGVWVVELGALQDPGLLLTTLMHRLGVPEEPGRTPEATLTAFLKPRRMLIVLDNCEHLAAAAAALTGLILAASLGVRVLATGRQALRVAGEVTLQVPPMEGDEAVALFAERARAARPGLSLDDHYPAVVEICRRLDGIPLAIELAAARANVMSPADILQRLDDRFRLLTAAPRSAAARHRTLEAAVDWSYELLGEPARALYRQLSIFAGGFSLEAAESVCSAGDAQATSVLDELGELVDQSLVQVQEVAGQVRYGMLETLRAYGRDKLIAAGELEAVGRRHTAYFLTLVEAAEPRLAAVGGQEWLERLDREQDNLRAVFERGGDPQLELRLAAALRGFWDARGQYAEGRSRLVAVLARAGEPSPVRAHALRGAAFLAWAQGDYEAARAWCGQSLELCREAGDRPGLGLTLQQLGQIAFQEERFADARSHLEQALAIAAEIDDRRLAAVCEFRLGMVARFEPDPTDARRHLESSLEAGRRLGDDELFVMSQLVLGQVAMDQGLLAEARERLVDSLLRWRERGSGRQVASLLDAFAGLAAAEGQHARAIRLAAAASHLRSAIAVAPASAFLGDLSERLRGAQTALADAQERADPEPPMGREEAISYALGEAKTRS